MKNKTKSKNLVGIVIILIGILFLLNNMNILPNAYLSAILQWEFLLIALGLFLYLSNKNKSAGIWLIIIGFIFLFPVAWPVLLILIGSYIIYRNQYHSPDKLTDTSDKTNIINDVSVFGGAKKTFQFNNFKGGSIIAIFGGSEIDLLDSTLAEGENRLEVLFVFGGATINIPADWNVQIETTDILGGIKDRRVLHSNQTIDEKRKLIITGILFMGGGELKNYVTF